MAKKKAVTKNIPSETPIPILDTNVDYTIKVVCKNEKQKSFVNSIKIYEKKYVSVLDQQVVVRLSWH